MEHLIFCLNATVPIFLMMAVGFFFRRIGLVDKVFADKMNAFVFKAALPALVFKDLAGADFFAVWDGPFVLFCLFTTGVSILSVLLVSRLFSAEIRGEFVQASYRSSVALLGVAFIETIYGTAGAAPLMIIGDVPLYNIAAVLVLTLMRPGRGRLERALLKKTFWDVASNPILIGILVGILWSLLRIPQPVIFQKTLSNFAGVATPMGLIGLGASVDAARAREELPPAMVCCFFKLIAFVALFLPVAVLLGYRTDKLVTVLIMLGSATTSSSFVMARNLGYEGALTANTVMLTTCLSAFTLTGWLYLLRSLGMV